jgi:hypothetical protein
MFGKRGYRRKVAASISEGGNALVDLIDAADAETATCQVLGQLVSIQADSLVEFLDEFRRDDSIRQLTSAATDPLAAQSALRVATWALALRVPASALGPRFPGVVESATDVFGIENPWERRLVFFEPKATGPGRDAEIGRELQFNRYTVEGMIAVASGIEEFDVQIPAIMGWAHHTISGFAALKAVMDYLQPQPGFSRLSQVEAEIRARNDAEAERTKREGDG